MITHLIFKVLGTVGAWVVGLLPHWGMPAWVTEASNTLSSWFASISDLGYFIPVGPIFTVVAAILAAYVIGFTIKMVRTGYSMFTGGGGAS